MFFGYVEFELACHTYETIIHELETEI